MKKILGIVLVLVTTLLLVACKDKGVYFTVSFDVGSNSNSVIDDQVIRNGSKVDKPQDPVSDELVFSGKWLYKNSNWDFNLDIVTEDMTLEASWLNIIGEPTGIKTTDEAFSSKITWVQTIGDIDTFEVSIKLKEETTYQLVEGSFELIDEEFRTVIFTPQTLPQGGMYDVKVTYDGNDYIEEGILLKGAGIETNPYLVSDTKDVNAILNGDKINNNFYLQYNDVITTTLNKIEVTNDTLVSFGGTYDGNDKALSFVGNGGLFNTVLETGIIKNLTIDSTTKLFAQNTNVYSIGAVANTNNGLIENISMRGNVEDPKLQGELIKFSNITNYTEHKSGAGGIVGYNNATGIIRNVTVSGSGSVKAARGLGGVAAYNEGLIEGALVSATLPAGNQANSGKSSNHYSFGGGIAGFNLKTGKIIQSEVTGRVFAQSAYSESGNGNEEKNSVFGGIVGFNEGLISEVSFARPMSSKEFINKSQSEVLNDAANNLGVASIHGDSYIGGIAGVNGGTIENFYVGGGLIAARDFVGGVTSLTLNGGSIKNGYVFAEVAIKDVSGSKITTANAKTTLTTYEIAPSGFEVSSTLFKSLLNVDKTIWDPNSILTPVLPEFNANDLLVVGNKFKEDGTLNYKDGQEPLIPIEEVLVSVDGYVLPNVNDSKSRFDVELGFSVELIIDVLPSNATNKNYTITVSNSRAKVNGNTVEFVLGSGKGNVSIKILFEDTSIGTLEYRFKTV